MTEGPLNELRDTCHAASAAKGWWSDNYSLAPNPYRVPAKLMLIVSEVAELMEAHRKEKGREELHDEMADVFIRLFDIAGWLDIDLDGAVAAKLEKNRERPYRHGGLRY